MITQAWSFFKGFFTSDNIGKTIDVVKEKVVDVDKQNEMIKDIAVAHASNKTIPILDGVHKLGRQVLIGSVVYFHMYCKLHDIELTLEELTALYGAVTAYTLLKGKGR